ncbi:redox-regulated ATPase YchF [Buchnera aphidicola]|uniref:redox-regulated ATPase YchF n=1 Tax=Buchnera aphidicola TaxID=9 RepID=UPI0025429109|nr:redox-regulated ATPase YchF [Buchnera aphidicola]WII23814.1 redox-regulated ATPase YchF [Buchnera aphidicola (Sipha maydis)]
MSLKCGIIGLPNVGKSTIFNLLTNLSVPSLNFPFCTINPNIGFAPVMDDRLLELEKIVYPEKVIRTFVKIVDIAGLVKGASQGEGLGNKFLSQISEVDSLIHVVRTFQKENILHVENKIDPLHDIEIINTELIFSDIEVCEKNLLLKKNYKNFNKDLVLQEKKILKKCLLHLQKFSFLKTLKLSSIELSYIKRFKFLTLKPTLFLINADLNQKNNILLNKLKDFLKNDHTQMIFPHLFHKNQSKIKKNNDISKIIRSIYQMLNLETFFTVGKKEIRAWPFLKNSRAIQAAKVIHSDFSKGFIRAKVISYLDFIKYKSENHAKKFGKLRLEGKDYIVHDGDIIHFLFNV